MPGFIIRFLAWAALVQLARGQESFPVGCTSGVPGLQIESSRQPEVRFLTWRIRQAPARAQNHIAGVAVLSWKM